MKKYKVWLHIEQETDADDMESALSIFWEDFHEAQANEELADIEEIKN